MANDTTKDEKKKDDKKKDETKRAHRATYARDKKKGGYLIRVEGPQAAAFVDREVPVTMKDGSEHTEKLVALIWSGVDQESGKPCALYSFEAKPREEEEIPF